MGWLAPVFLRYELTPKGIAMGEAELPDSVPDRVPVAAGLV